MTAGLAVIAGCEAGKIEPPPPHTSSVLVAVATAQKQNVPLNVRNIGTVEPYAVVAVKARVSGQINRVDFTKGQEVKKGDLLFVIDPRTWEAAVAQAEANVKRDVARKENADADLRRAEKLVKTRAISEEQFEQIHADANAAGATVEADRAAVALAKVQLDYCTICSPIDGRVGDILIDEGNLVKADDTAPLVVINQIKPIYVRFAVPEQLLPEIRKHMAIGPLEVDVDPNNGTPPKHGTLTFVDNAIDRNTGTIELKATFINEDRQLWPGQFVDVTLRLSTLADAIVVPKEAIQTGQNGDYVFIVKADDTVEMRPVQKGISVVNDVVVAHGLKAGERVVTDGQLRLAEGSHVTIKQDAAAGKGKSE